MRSRNTTEAYAAAIPPMRKDLGVNCVPVEVAKCLNIGTQKCVENKHTEETEEK